MVKIMSVLVCLAVLNVAAALYKERLYKRRCAKKFERLLSSFEHIKK